MLSMVLSDFRFGKFFVGYFYENKLKLIYRSEVVWGGRAKKLLCSVKRNKSFLARTSEKISLTI